MVLTRDFRETITERAWRDHEFARALLDEAATLFLATHFAHYSGATQ